MHFDFMNLSSSSLQVHEPSCGSFSSLDDFLLSVVDEEEDDDDDVEDEQLQLDDEGELLDEVLASIFRHDVLQ